MVATTASAHGIRRGGATGIALALAALLALAAGGCGGDGGSAASQPANILFITMDDVGIDQLRSFGYGGATPPAVPSLDAIAHGGVRFRNTWSTPECSPSRAMFYDGRYPFRTGVVAAYNTVDLANFQLSPYEYTTPRLLAARGYESGFFGKFHISGPHYNPYGNGAPLALGFDVFYGTLEGGPYSIDESAGGAGPEGTYPCGFVPDASQPGGADVGACYFSANGPCRALAASAGAPAPGLRCLQMGGLFAPNATCQAQAPANLTFATYNAYYVSPFVINEADGQVIEVPTSDARTRRYRTEQETDAAIAWIRSRAADTPWMASVSYTANHAPYQQPPMHLLPPGTPDNSGLDCLDAEDQRVLSNQTVEAMDAEIGRLLVETGVARRTADGTLHYDPRSNTWVVVTSDNGSYLSVVKVPFDPERAKGTIYQTGVWVPLLVAGPGVAGAGRAVESMVNVVDLFALFGEIAGIDVRREVPAWRQLDAAPVMPYLTRRDPASIRTTNFSYVGEAVASPDAPPSPCVIAVGDGSICTEALPTKGVCDSQNGTWYGAGAVVDTALCGPSGCASCCEVQHFYLPELELLATSAASTRDAVYKLVETTIPDCSTPGAELTTYEFYRIDEAAPAPRLDREDDNLLTAPTLPPQGLDAEQQAAFDALYAELQRLLTSEIECPGDGNDDLLVDQTDLDEWAVFSAIPGEANSSWYDFNLDGLTNELDRQVIEDHFGADCRPAN